MRWVWFVALLLVTGCADMTPQQQSAAMGTLLGTTVGALSSQKHSKRNAMIGGLAGLAGGLFYGQRQQQQQTVPCRPYRSETLQEENARLRRELEVERLRRENARLRQERARYYRRDTGQGVD